MTESGTLWFGGMVGHPMQYIGSTGGYTVTDKKLNFMEAMEAARQGATVQYESYQFIFLDGSLRYTDINDSDKKHCPVCVSNDVLDAQYIIATPAPQKTVKVAQYAYRYGEGGHRTCVESGLYTDDEAFLKAFSYASRPNWFKRLDYTEIEVPE